MNDDKPKKGDIGRHQQHLPPVTREVRSKAAADEPDETSKEKQRMHRVSGQRVKKDAKEAKQRRKK